MANTFKTVTKAGVTSADVIYTVASSTTTVVLGIMVGNTTTVTDYCNSKFRFRYI